MLFPGADRHAVQEGAVTVAFRRWRFARVTPDAVYRTNAGRIRVDEVTTVSADAIDDVDARRAGRSSADAVRRELRGDPSYPLFRIAFSRVTEPDPRDQLAADDTLAASDVDEITRRLHRLDRASHHGPWTAQTLWLIEGQPVTAARELAAQVSRETLPFKRDVRKLKALGLTLSLVVGYRLSPRGRAYLESVQDRRK